MHFFIPELSASSCNLNMPLAVTCTCGFVTTDAESILRWSTQGVRDTGAWLACAKGPRKSAGCSESLVAQPPERRSNCPSQTVLRSNSHLLIRDSCRLL